jgi:hypothetical protein
MEGMGAARAVAAIKPRERIENFIVGKSIVGNECEEKNQRTGLLLERKEEKNGRVLATESQ